MMYLDYQRCVWHWLKRCFGEEIAEDPQERNFRFLEEALELVQSCDFSKEDALKAVHYVFDRERGDIEQEVGGVAVCLAALCAANNVDMAICANKELNRVNDPEMINKIRQKHSNKPVDMRGSNSRVERMSDGKTGLLGVDTP